MRQKLPEKATRVLTERSHKNYDFHASVKVLQIKNRFRDVEQRSSGDEHGSFKQFVAHLLDRCFVVVRCEYLIASGPESSFQYLFRVWSDNIILATRQSALANNMISPITVE